MRQLEWIRKVVFVNLTVISIWKSKVSFKCCHRVYNWRSAEHWVARGHDWATHGDTAMSCRQKPQTWGLWRACMDHLGVRFNVLRSIGQPLGGLNCSRYWHLKKAEMGTEYESISSFLLQVLWCEHIFRSLIMINYEVIFNFDFSLEVLYWFWFYIEVSLHTCCNKQDHFWNISDMLLCRNKITH